MFRSNQRQRSVEQRAVPQQYHKRFSTDKACLLCGNLADPNDHLSKSLCHACIGQIPWIKQIMCARCGRYEDCHDCQRREKTYFICNRSAVRYDPVMRDWLAQYKYRKNERLAPIMVEMLSYAFQRLQSDLANAKQKVDGISYVPLSLERMEERGFNQAEQLARGIAERFRLPVVPLLRKIKHTPKQSYKARVDRLRDLTDVFHLDTSQVGYIFSRFANVQPLNIVLVDDVYTTGSTLNQCAQVITAGMNTYVYGLTWAR